MNISNPNSLLSALIFAAGCCLTVSGLPCSATAAPIYNPVTGHYYEVVDSSVTWDQAAAAAQTNSYLGATGYLATLTSQQEDDFVLGLLDPTKPIAQRRYALGGYRPQMAGPQTSGWNWVTGEPWGYTNWAAGEPNGSGSSLAYGLHYYFLNSNSPWNDAGDGSVFPGYIVEYPGLTSQTLTVPATTAFPVSSAPLNKNTLYLVEARGTWSYSASGLIADAEWTRNSQSQWSEGVKVPGSHDLYVNNTDIDWFGSSNGTTYQQHTYSPNHVYRYYISGNGSPLSFHISDSAYGDNSGSLEVEIAAVGKTSGSRNYPEPPTAPSPPVAAVPYLREWNGTSWVPVSVGSLGSGNIHVLTHGWGREEKDWVIQNPGRGVWDMRDGTGAGSAKSEFFDGFQGVAESVYMDYLSRGESTANFHVVTYSWIDESATDTSFPADAQASKSRSYSAGHRLAAMLQYAGGLHLMGHSHGSNVVSQAALDLERSGIQVDHLTLWDSPEHGLPALTPLYAGAHNLLNVPGSSLSRLDTGTGLSETFVDNYISLFGEDYDDAVNVRLIPGAFGVRNPADWHGYPMDWYAGATDNEVGVNWSPLLGFDASGLSNKYSQDTDDEFVLHAVPDSVLLDIAKNALSAIDVGFIGHVVDAIGGKRLIENSPAYWDSVIEVADTDIAIQFDYEFLNAGDGDELGIWIDDELRFVVEGYLAGVGLQSALIDVSDLNAGSHLMTVALHNTGDANAEIFVGNFNSISAVPEPAGIVLLAVCGLFGCNKFILSCRGKWQRST